MTPEKTKNVAVISTLWPNAVNPRFGTFVARSLEALQKDSDWNVTAINPIGLSPIALGRYRGLAEAAVDGVEQGIHVYRPTFRLLPKVGGRLNPDLIARAILPLIRRLHAEQPFDLIDAQFFYPDGPAAAQIAAALNLPLSIKARGADIHLWGSRNYGRDMMVAAADQAAGVLAVSEALAEDMADMGIARDKITIHYTGLDRDRFRPLDNTALRRHLGEEMNIPFARDEVVLMTLGALIPRKGQEFVIRAMAGMENTRLLLVGMGQDEQKLRALAHELGVADRVHFTGSIDHDLLPPLLSAADVMVLPSTSEGLANAWIEALACGTPLVVTESGGIREIMRDPATGVIVDRTPEAIRAGIQQVLDQNYSREDVAATVEQFSWRANAQALAKYYDGLIL